MKRKLTAGIAATGVSHVAKIVSQCNSIFTPVPQENDIGLDGQIEFIVDEASTGCCVGIQIKSGESYLRGEACVIPCDAAHREYWKHYNLPIAGIVYDPTTDSARWVDITAWTDTQEKDPPASSIAANLPFDTETFDAFRTHFLGYSARYSDERNFGERSPPFLTLIALKSALHR